MNKGEKNDETRRTWKNAVRPWTDKGKTRQNSVKKKKSKNKSVKRFETDCSIGKHRNEEGFKKNRITLGGHWMNR